VRALLPLGTRCAHNGTVSDQQLMPQCPQCGSADAVHAISELAALASSQLAQAQQGLATGPIGPQQGYQAEPQAGPLPGWAQEPQAGPPSGSRWPSRGGVFGGRLDNSTLGDGIGDAIADVALGAATRFIGRAIGRGVQRTINERVMPTLAVHRETTLREQIAIAERYPGIRACMTDKVIFLEGGSRVAPMPNLVTLTMQQADAIVAELRQG
jgi:hypothetical protein